MILTEKIIKTKDNIIDLYSILRKGDVIKIKKDYPNWKLIREEIKHRNNDDVGIVKKIRVGIRFPIVVKFKNDGENFYLEKGALVKINGVRR